MSEMTTPIRNVANRYQFLNTCWRAIPENLNGIYERCNQDTALPRRRLNLCAKPGCRNRFCSEIGTCCIRFFGESSSENDSEDTDPLVDYICLPCHASQQAPSRTGEEHSLSRRASNITDNVNLPTQRENVARLPLRGEESDANEVMSNLTKEHEELFKCTTRSLRAVLDILKRNNVLKPRTLNFGYLEASNGKYHMSFLRKSLLSLVKRIDDLLEIGEASAEDMSMLTRASNTTSKVVDLSIKLQQADSTLVFGTTRDDICVICIENYNAEDEVTTLPCGHSFHNRCVSQIVNASQEHCPTCRDEIRYENLVDNESSIRSEL